MREQVETSTTKPVHIPNKGASKMYSYNALFFALSPAIPQKNPCDKFKCSVLHPHCYNSGPQMLLPVHTTNDRYVHKNTPRAGQHVRRVRAVPSHTQLHTVILLPIDTQVCPRKLTVVMPVSVSKSAMSLALNSRTLRIRRGPSTNICTFHKI
jgi:hypothetical protein